MTRLAVGIYAFILGLCAMGTAGAHHPPLMERCYSLTFTGQIERIDWRNPHVELSIRTDEGESHRVVWLNMQQLVRAGIDKDTLHTGDQVTATVGTREDVVDRPMLLAAITRTGDGWAWSQVPQGC
jgi:hypothetical protein